MKNIQTVTNILFKAFLIFMLTFNFGGDIFSSIILGIIIGFLSEIGKITLKFMYFEFVFKALYKSYIVAILILTINPTFVFAVPIGILVGLFSEGKNL